MFRHRLTRLLAPPVIIISFAHIAYAVLAIPSAQEVEATPAPLSNNVSTYATDLIYPRGLKFGPDGNLYVAESGNGGDVESMGTCENYTSPFTPYHPAMTARVTMIGPDGTQTIVADGMPSARDAYGDVVGSTDVAFIDDVLYVLNAGGGCSRGNPDAPTGVYRANTDASAEVVGDLSTFFPNNPSAAPLDDDYEPDGAANAMVAYDGKLYVVNANHATFEEVSLDGSIRRVLDISATEGHITPTALTLYEGNFYIGNLGVFPVDAGISKVYKVTPEGEIEVYAEGLTMVLGLAFDDQGQLYVLESSTADDEFPVAGAGRVVRVADDGTLDVIATGLSYPIGMTFGPDGFLYVSNYGYGGDPSAGE
ncbi:MAG: ScyD/ScyE family protein, partial [Anaerolineae bacterium]|nr:ScyD/ScyE family protein [Anaerolineae bacterium]